MADERAPSTAPETSQSLITLTHVMYGLHAFSLLTEVHGAATFADAFLWLGSPTAHLALLRHAARVAAWPSIIAVILNHIKRSEARGTWLESHFRWQIRTFWYGLLWVVPCAVFVVLTSGVGLLIAWLPLGVVGLWFIYRVVRGWLRLVGHQPMYR